MNNRSVIPVEWIDISLRTIASEWGKTAIKVLHKSKN